MGGWQGGEGATSFFFWNKDKLNAGFGEPCRPPGPRARRSWQQPGAGTVTAARGKTMAMEARSRRGLDGERGDTADTSVAPSSPLTCELGGTHGTGPLGHPLRGETLTKFVPSLTHTPHRRRAAPTKAGGEQGGKKEKRIKSTMKRHNKHQLYPKSGAASFQQTSGCRGAALLLRTPIINLGEGGVGGTFPPSFPFVPLPRSAPRRKRCSPGCRRGAAPRRRAGREGKQGGRAVQGQGRRAEKRGCRCPSARAAAGHGRTRTPTFCVW